MKTLGKIIAGIIFSVFLYVVGVASSLVMRSSLANKSSHRDKNIRLTSLAEEANRELPIKISEEMQLDSCKYVAQTTSMNYYCTANFLDESPKALQALATQAKTVMTTQAKSSNDFAGFRSAEITLKYFYTNSKGKILAEISITPEEYKR